MHHRAAARMRSHLTLRHRASEVPMARISMQAIRIIFGLTYRPGRAAMTKISDVRRSYFGSSIELGCDQGCYRHLMTLYFSMVSSVFCLFIRWNPENSIFWADTPRFLPLGFTFSGSNNRSLQFATVQKYACYSRAVTQSDTQNTASTSTAATVTQRPHK